MLQKIIQKGRLSGLLVRFAWSDAVFMLEGFHVETYHKNKGSSERDPLLVHFSKRFLGAKPVPNSLIRCSGEFGYLRRNLADPFQCTLFQLLTGSGPCQFVTRFCSSCEPTFLFLVPLILLLPNL